jgi:hypothetical protein
LEERTVISLELVEHTAEVSKVETPPAVLGVDAPNEALEATKLVPRSAL